MSKGYEVEDFIIARRVEESVGGTNSCIGSLLKVGCQNKKYCIREVNHYKLQVAIAKALYKARKGVLG